MQPSAAAAHVDQAPYLAPSTLFCVSFRPCCHSPKYSCCAMLLTSCWLPTQELGGPFLRCLWARMFRELPEPLGNDRNAENFRHYFADPQERKFGPRGMGKGLQKHLTSQLPLAMEMAPLGVPPCLLTWEQRPLE